MPDPTPRQARAAALTEGVSDAMAGWAHSGAGESAVNYLAWIARLEELWGNQLDPSDETLREIYEAGETPETVADASGRQFQRYTSRP